LKHAAGACACALACLAALAPAAHAAAPGAASSDTAAPAVRVEARSAHFLAVGLVHGEVMSVHLSRLLDNAPVTDATLTLGLRGGAHAATAEADGGYSVRAAELALPGSAAVVFTVVQGPVQERLQGTLQIAGAPLDETPRNAARQYGWWALNFAVCIAFLYLWSRRKKAD
jgi:hypothetical protein